MHSENNSQFPLNSRRKLTFPRHSSEIKVAPAQQMRLSPPPILTIVSSDAGGHVVQHAVDRVTHAPVKSQLFDGHLIACWQIEGNDTYPPFRRFQLSAWTIRTMPETMAKPRTARRSHSPVRLRCNEWLIQPPSANGGNNQSAATI